MFKSKLLLFVLFLFVVVVPFQSVCIAQDAEQNELIPVKTEKATDIKTTAQKASEALDGTQSEWGLAVVGFLLGGFLFLFMEIAIIPGFGIAGIIGLILLLSAIVFAFLKLSLNMALVATGSAILGSVLLLLWLFYIFPKTNLGKKFVLQGTSSAEEGYTAVRDLSRYVGKEGVAVSMLRPSGVAKIDGDRMDVITDCEYLEKGTRIKVIKAKAGRIIVASIEE